MRTLLVCALLLALCPLTANAMSMTEVYKPGHIYPLSRTPEMPKDIEELMNFPGRVYGEHTFFSEIGDWETLLFQGGTRMFSRFLEKFAKLSFSPMVLLIEARPSTGMPITGGPREPVAFDWKYTRWIPGSLHEGMPESGTIELPLGGHVELEKVNVPLNVEIMPAKGLPSADLARIKGLLAEHEKRRELAGLPGAKVAAEHKAKVEHISTVISGLSEHKSKLLIDEPASANPQVGHVVRKLDWGNVPFITAYRVSSPFTAKIEGVGQCIVLGAVSLLAEARTPKEQLESITDTGKQLPSKASAGVYMLAYTGSTADEEKVIGSVMLVEVTGLGPTRTFADRLNIRATHHTRPSDVIYEGEDWYGVRVTFPNKHQVSDSNPAWRAKVLMAIPEPDGRYRSYEFELDLDIPMV